MSDTTRITMQITGLSCAGCVGRAERALAAVEGVTQASVNLANASAQVEGRPDLSPDTLVKALAEAGYPAAETQDAQLSSSTCSAA